MEDQRDNLIAQRHLRLARRWKDAWPLTPESAGERSHEGIADMAPVLDLERYHEQN